MFTEFNNSKCHHFIGFMDGCLSSTLGCLSFQRSLSDKHTQTHAPSPPPATIAMAPIGAVLWKKWQSSRILLQTAAQSYKVTGDVPPLLSLMWVIKPLSYGFQLKAKAWGYYNPNNDVSIKLLIRQTFTYDKYDMSESNMRVYLRHSSYMYVWRDVSTK